MCTTLYKPAKIRNRKESKANSIATPKNQTLSAIQYLKLGNTESVNRHQRHLICSATHQPWTNNIAFSQRTRCPWNQGKMPLRKITMCYGTVCTEDPAMQCNAMQSPKRLREQNSSRGIALQDTFSTSTYTWLRDKTNRRAFSHPNKWVLVITHQI